nr:hypothetical protein [Bacteroidota bacterium]
QFPWQSWWIGHHSSLGTLKSYDDGSVKPFTPHRLLDFVFDFLMPLHAIDTNKIVLSGTSMGGSGTSMVGIRNGQLFSNLIGWVGVHSPGKSPTFQSSFENALGDSAWKCNFSNVEFTSKYGGIEITREDNYNVWDYFDNAHWLAENPTAELPWHSFSNGANDYQIGWPQAQEYAVASMDYKAPFNFSWGMNGHSQRARVLAPYGYESDRNSHLVFRRDQSFPVFTNSGSDDDPMVDLEGQINNYFFWNTDSIIDTGDRWEMSICIIPEAPFDSVITDVTPRRLQCLTINPSSIYLYAYYDGDQLVSSGTVTADEFGFVTICNLVVNKNWRSVVLEALPTQILQIPAGWSGISTWLLPIDPDVGIMFENLAEQLIYLGNSAGYYMPQQGINTLTGWNSHLGYMVKMTQPVSLQITGMLEDDLTIQLEAGWNLIPVLGTVDVSSDDLFSQLGSTFVAATDLAGYAVFWPAYSIHTLEALHPGKSYLVKVNQPVVLNYGVR